jgi:hypothetical protein
LLSLVSSPQYSALPPPELVLTLGGKEQNGKISSSRERNVKDMANEDGNLSALLREGNWSVADL